MITAVAVVLLMAVVAYAVFGGADFRSRVLGPDRRRPRARRPPARSSNTRSDPCGSQPRLVDLHLRDPVDVVLEGIRLDHADAVRSADDRGLGHRPARSELRLPQGGRHDAEPSHSRRGVRPFLGARALLHGSDRGRDRVGTSAGRRRAGDPVDSWINPTSVVGGVLAVAAVAYLSAVYLVWDARRLDQVTWPSTSAARAVVSAVVVAVIAVAGAFVLRADAAYLFDGLTTRARPVLILSTACGARSPAARSRRRPWRRALALAAIAAAVISWGVAQTPHPAGEPHLLRGRSPFRHVDRGAGRGGAGGRGRAPGFRPALRPRSARSPARGGSRGRGRSPGRKRAGSTRSAN